jgi:3,5-epimerase/4-reductase
MKILFYGADGWIGNMIFNKWKDLYPEHTLIISKTRIIPENIYKIVEEIKNSDRVFSTIGRTSGGGIPNIDYLEDHLNENVRDNLFAPIFLAQLCRENDKHFSYIGTGCIFSRNTRQNDYVYDEADMPDYFGSAYSVVKGYTDTLMKTFYNHVLNFRIRMPITDDWNPKNFIVKISKFQKICNYPNSMTYLPNIIPIMIKMSVEEIVGTYNMVNGSISHKEILDSYKEIIDFDHTYNLIEEDELNSILKSKRSNNILNNKQLIKYCCDEGVNLKSMEYCIMEALTKMKKNIPK